MTVIVTVSSCSITQAQELTALSQVDISPLCYFISFDSLLCTPSTSLPNIQNVNPADIICVSCLDSAVSAAAAAASDDLHISATESADVPSSTSESASSLLSSSSVICDVSPSTGATTSVDHTPAPPPRADALEPSMTLNNANKRIAKKTAKTKCAERKMISRCRSAPLTSSSPSASGSSSSAAATARRRGKLPLQASQCDDEGVASPSSTSSSPPSRAKR